MKYPVAVTILAGLMPLYVVRLSVWGIPTNIFELVVLAVFLFGLMSKAVRESWLHTWRSAPKSIKIAGILFLLSACISTAISHELRVSLGILKGWFIIPILFSFIIASASKNNIKLRSDIFSSIIYSGSIVVLFGISQIGSVPRIFSLYDVPNSLALFLVPVSIIAVYTGVQQKNKLYIFMSIIMLIAIFATKSFGALFALTGAFLVWLVSNHRVPLSPIGERAPCLRTGRRVRASQANCISPAYAIPLRSRATRDAEATAGRPAPIPSFLLIRGKGIARSLLLTKEKAGMRCVVLIVLVVALFSFFYLPRIQYFISPFINSNTHSSLSVRLQLWNIGSRLIAQHPLLGVGLGQFEPAYQAELHKLFALESRGVKTTSYKLQAEYVFRDPHNFFISFWLNTGIFGLVSFLYLNWVAIRNAIRSKDAFQKSVGLALMAMLLFGLVDTIYWKNDLSALWWALTLLLLVGH